MARKATTTETPARTGTDAKPGEARVPDSKVLPGAAPGAAAAKVETEKAPQSPAVAPIVQAEPPRAPASAVEAKGTDGVSPFAATPAPKSAADAAPAPGSTAARPADAPAKPAAAAAASAPPAPPQNTGAGPAVGGKPPVAAAPRRPVLPMLLAGVVTAGLGLGAGYLLWAPGGYLYRSDEALTRQLAELGTRLGSSETALAELGARLEAQAGEVSPLAGRLDSAEAGIAALAPLGDAVAAQDGRSADLAAALEALGSRLTDLAQRPPASDPAAVAAYERELTALRTGFEQELAALRGSTDAALSDIRGSVASEMARLAAEQEAAAELRDDSAELRRSAERTAAFAALSAALDAGLPLSGPLDQLAEAAPELDLAPLRAHAAGVPALVQLQQDFPVAARAALAAEAADGGGEGGVSGALKGFLGLRTLSPQEGTGTDAVLSRAEAALRSGDLAAALAELEALAPVPAAELSGWRAAAGQRLAASIAHETLKDAVEK